MRQGTKTEGLRQAAGLGLATIASAGIAHADDAAGTAAKDTGRDENPIIVTGQRSNLDALSGRIIDLPQSINVVPAEVIRQQGVSSLQEALKNVPGITLNAGEGGTHGDLVNLRGFSAGDDYFLDGLRDTGLYDRDAFDVEGIEVYKGPASTLFGRGSTGGVINQVSKAPHLGDFANVTLTGGTNDETRVVADGNFQFADHAAVRIAAMSMDAGIEGRPSFVETKRWGVAPSIAFGIGTDTQATLRYLHQHEDNMPDYGIPFVFGRPAPVAHDAFYGLPADDKFATDVDVVTGRFEHRFGNNITFADNARYGHYDFDSRQTAAIYGSANCYNAPLPYAGAPNCATTTGPVPVTTFNPLYPVLGTPLDQIFVERDRPSSTGTIKTLMNSATLTANIDAFGVTQTLIGGVEYDREDADLVRFTNQNTVIPPTPLLNPDPNQAFPGTQTTVRQRPSTRTQTTGVFIADTVHVGAHWDFIGALRFDHFHAQFDQPVGTQSHFRHTDEVTSPRAAIVYKPSETSSIYFSYGTSFNPSAENLSLAANNQALPPEKDRTYEIGAKWAVFDQRLALTAAVFNTEMTNARITDPLTPSLQSLAGTLRINGFEANIQGHITDDWEIVAGYTYLDPEAVGLIAAGVKGPVPNTAHHQANLWTTYELPHGFEIGGGLNYISDREAGADNATIPGQILVAAVPGYVTADAMASYEFNEHVRLQLNGYNLTDKFYYANSYFSRAGENHAVPGAGRTFLLTLGLSY
ncbi:MAG: TonB-dependent siderophore receptor [Alphaproteobacteria bacterium]